MKTNFVLLLLLLNFGSASAQSFEMEIPLSGVVKFDTINKISRNGLKEGKWVIKGKHYGYGTIKDAYRGFQAEQIIETGMYVNNRREGEWIEFHITGKMRSKLTYVNGALDGPATFYDEKGNVLKAGSFKENKWVQ